MSDTFSEWDMKVAQWRGETLRALEDINSDIDEIKNDIKDIKQQNNTRDIKTAEIAGGVAILITICLFLVQYAMA